MMDWRSQKYILWGSFVFVLATLLTVCSFLNYPHPILTADSESYFVSVRQIQATSNPVGPWRLPVYPLLIILMHAVAGQGYLMVVSILQGVLYVLTALEFYMLAALILKRGWLAFLISLFVSTNLILLSYSKPIMTEGLSLWLLTTFVLCAIYFVKTLQVRILWLVLICLLLLCFTRPEWAYFPILFYAYLFFLLIPRHDRRRLLLPILASVVVIYALIGSYIAVNALHNGYAGLSYIENINLLGKILQYNMQNEAPAQYQQISHALDTFVAKGIRSPFAILYAVPELARNYAKPSADFAIAIIVRHPGEFFLKTIPYIFSSLTYYYPAPQNPVPGLFNQPLTWLLSVHRALYDFNALFLPCAFAWIALLCWRRTRKNMLVRNMSLIVFIALYELVITTFGGYFESDYARFHTVFNPLIALTIWSLLSLCLLTAALKIRVRFASTSS
ncbi:MAG TPA: hypothetical protein VKR83_09040 [Ktedonobacteraceae bacterium]|nr:hypothetical protein [Ktedonobacteraceae bacterium]